MRFKNEGLNDKMMHGFKGTDELKDALMSVSVLGH